MRSTPHRCLTRGDANCSSPRLHLGDSAGSAGVDTVGRFLCPCHGSRFDLAGRVVCIVPAPINLDIPEYRFTATSTLQIG